MKKFMDQDFLLSNPTAVKLFHMYAEYTPILDYHCHINPREIAEDRSFDNITQVWLGGDHYKWRFMRSCGVEEKYITGDASDYEKFKAWARVLGSAIGNPLYHWSHLELQRYFNYHGALNEKTADEVWNRCNEMLRKPEMSARNLILMSGVTLICTTDDPVDSLEYHKMIKDDPSFDVQVLPAWRPDRAMNINKPDFTDYIKKLSEVSGLEIKSFEDVLKALSIRLDFFQTMGCSVSDHGLDYAMYAPASMEEIEAIFNKRMAGQCVSALEEAQYKTAFMLAMGRECSKRNFVMQLHYGCKRDNNTAMYKKIGADTGFDAISNYTPSNELADFLNALAETDELPKTILYSLNPNDNQAIDTIMGCFQDSSAVGKIQHGSAWWFNDNKTGMIDQLTSLANLGNLAGFVGMLTDSRSFLSYTRHEYFRRILCNFIGTLVENGEFPEDYDILGKVVKDISYYNAVRYFGFDL
ncbi:MAG: glucuronate isomerase [Lachnospiraceae bacterium]|nr:glucuronate isomerase [Lachnospiraceae bacterium]